MKKYLAGIIFFTFIDILYTAIGAFWYGGAELNPLFSWITQPLPFIIFISSVKIITIGWFIVILLYLNSTMDTTDDHVAWTKVVLLHANVVYGVLLLGIFAANIIL
jgi:hypothetical protein